MCKGIFRKDAFGFKSVIVLDDFELYIISSIYCYAKYI